MISLTELIKQIDNDSVVNDLEQTEKKLDWLEAINSICLKLDVNPDDVLEHLVCRYDEQDFIDGYLSKEQLSGFIKLWVSNGKQRRYK